MTTRRHATGMAKIVPGATAAVVHGDELAWIAGTGFADQRTSRHELLAGRFRGSGLNFCTTKGFRGYAGYVATGAIRIQADALPWHDRMLGQWRGSLFERLGWAPIQSGIEKRHGCRQA